MVATVVLVPVAGRGCEPVPIQLAKFKQVLGECLGNSARVEIQLTMPDAAPETHVYRVAHSQEAGVRAGSRVAGPNVIEFVSRRYEHCQNAMLVYFEEGTDRLQWFGARKVVAAVAQQCQCLTWECFVYNKALLVVVIILGVVALVLLSSYFRCSINTYTERVDQIRFYEAELLRLKSEHEASSGIWSYFVFPR